MGTLPAKARKIDDTLRRVVNPAIASGTALLMAQMSDFAFTFNEFELLSAAELSACMRPAYSAGLSCVGGDANDHFCKYSPTSNDAACDWCWSSPPRS